MRAVLNLALRDDYITKETGHTDSAAREQRYESLVARMAAHQQGTGPAPTTAEFEQWKEDATFNLAMHRLLAGTPRT